MSQRVSKMSLDSEATSFSNRSDCSESGSEEEDVFKPFMKSRTSQGERRMGSSGGSSSSNTESSSKGTQNSVTRGHYHRPNSGVKNASFWSVLRNSTNNNRPSIVEEADKTSQSGPRNKLAEKAKDIMIEKRVLKLFMEIDKLKGSRLNLPNI